MWLTFFAFCKWNFACGQLSGTFKFSEFQALHNPQSYKKVKLIPRITAARLMGGLLCQKIELVTGLLVCRGNALSVLSKMFV